MRGCSGASFDPNTGQQPSRASRHARVARRQPAWSIHAESTRSRLILSQQDIVGWLAGWLSPLTSLAFHTPRL